MYNVSSLKYLGTIPYNLDAREASAVGPKEKSDKKPIGPKVSQILVDKQSEKLGILFADNSLAIMSIGKNTLLGYLFGHFQKVSGAKWLSSKLQSCLVTCSYDMSIFFWQHCGDRWSFTYFDIPKFIDSSLRHYRLALQKSLPSVAITNETGSVIHKQGLSLTALAVHPKYNYVICGNNQGSVWMFDLTKGVLLFHHNLTPLKIVEMTFSPSGNFLAVAHCTGLINLYDLRSNFELLLQLEGPLKMNTLSEKLSKLYSIGVIIAKDPPAASSYYPATEQMLNISKTANRSIAPLNSNTDRGSSPVKGMQFEEPTFSALCTHNLSTLRLHKVYVKGGKVFEDPFIDLPIDAGKIAGFDIHPSNEYAIVISDAGYLYIFHIHLSQLRGKYQIPKHAWGCKIDPSGLYVTISVPSKNIEKESDAYLRTSILLFTYKHIRFLNWFT